MFYRPWTALPQDAEFPCDLKALGYFVNDEDEIRSIESPDTYFRYQLDLLERVNDRQRFAFNTAVEGIIHERLENEGLEKVRLPWDTPEDEPNVPIFVSSDIKSKKRVIIIFGETSQMLGALAMRIVNGRGGVDKGSLVSIVREIKKQHCSPDDDDSPGIILANMGETFWWPEGKRALELPRWNATPAPSMVQVSRAFRPQFHCIRGHDNHHSHVEYIFDEVLNVLVRPDAKIDIIAIGDGGEAVEKFFNHQFTWAIFGPRVNSMVLLGDAVHSDLISCPGFKNFLKKRTRAYVVEPSLKEQVPLATSHEAHNGHAIHGYFGCPVYSSGEYNYVECILPRAKEHILKWIQQVADDEDYENDPNIATVNPYTEELGSPEAPKGDSWDDIPEEERPTVSFADQEMMETEVRLTRMWDNYKKTGRFESV